MKIPKYIDRALKQRTKLALQLDSISYSVDEFLIKHNIEPDTSCWGTGVEIYIHPFDAEEEVRRAIEKA